LSQGIKTADIASAMYRNLNLPEAVLSAKKQSILKIGKKNEFT
jgi:hypothetical protein